METIWVCFAFAFVNPNAEKIETQAAKSSQLTQTMQVHMHMQNSQRLPKNSRALAMGGITRRGISGWGSNYYRSFDLPLSTDSLLMLKNISMGQLSISSYLSGFVLSKHSEITGDICENI